MLLLAVAPVASAAACAAATQVLRLHCRISSRCAPLCRPACGWSQNACNIGCALQWGIPYLASQCVLLHSLAPESSHDGLQMRFAKDGQVAPLHWSARAFMSAHSLLQCSITNTFAQQGAQPCRHMHCQQERGGPRARQEQPWRLPHRLATGASAGLPAPACACAAATTATLSALGRRLRLSVTHIADVTVSIAKAAFNRSTWCAPAVRV